MTVIEPPFYIELKTGEAPDEARRVIQKLLATAGHGNPAGVKFDLPRVHEFDGSRFIEFACLAGSAWSLLVLAARRGVMDRRLMHHVGQPDGSTKREEIQK